MSKEKCGNSRICKIAQVQSNYKHHSQYRSCNQWRTEGQGVWGVQTPPEILKALQNRAILNPIVKTVKNC